MLNRTILLALLLNGIYAFSQVKITLQNDTNERIDLVQVEGIDVGSIEKDSSKSIVVKSVTNDSGHPMPNISLLLHNEKISTLRSPCATFLKSMTEGNINRKITIMQTNGKKFIVLEN